MDKHPFWSALASAAVPYIPGEQPRDRVFIKLNTNENPYGPSPRISADLLAKEPFQLYPEPTCYHLRKVIAEGYGLTEDEVFAGNGSDEVLGFAFGAFGDENHPFAFPDITYSFYPVWTDFWRTIPVQIVPLREDLSIDLKSFPDCDGVSVIANPNAPTGIALSAQVLKDYLAEHRNRLLIVDEAYVDFGAESMVPYIHEFPNLLVVQTFSKSRALAGLRLGFAMGQKELIDALIRIKDSFNSYTVSRLTQVCGALSFEDSAYFNETVSRIMHTREQAKTDLRSLGFQVTDSKANFLWVLHPSVSGSDLYTALREEGILVRHFSAPALTDYLRITVGTDEEMEALKKALIKILEKTS